MQEMSNTQLFKVDVEKDFDVRGGRGLGPQPSALEG